jgi:anti-sigma regulatory factor (Ser/Thr protein kinase)
VLEPGVGDLQRVTEGLQGLHHVALFYHKASSADYLSTIREFVQAGLDLAEPVFVAVPHDKLPAGWRLPADPSVTFADMRRIGSNPARIIPALWAFADRHPGQRVRYLAESVWASRPAAEQQAAARYEWLVNLAFAGSQASIVCLYNETDLPAAVIAGAYSTHPTLLGDGGERDSQRYLGPQRYPDGLDEPLPSPPGDAATLAYDADLRQLRALVRDAAQRAGLSASRCMDLVIAASEVAANTLRHTGAGGVARVWRTDCELLCQIEDNGYIRDPLAGYHRPAEGLTGGQGLWLVNQVCDLVEIRTSQTGTTIRLHMYRS